MNVSKLTISKSITSTVRDAVNGDEEAYKKLSLIIQLPFSSIEMLYGTDREDLFALNILACLRLRMFGDKSALTFLTSAKNPFREIFSVAVGLIKL